MRSDARTIPRPSMGLEYMHTLHPFHLNVGKSDIHGWSGVFLFSIQRDLRFTENVSRRHAPPCRFSALAVALLPHAHKVNLESPFDVPRNLNLPALNLLLYINTFLYAISFLYSVQQISTVGCSCVDILKDVLILCGISYFQSFIGHLLLLQDQTSR